MKPLNNLLDKIFGRLTVVSRGLNPGTRKNDTAAYWNCICSCGKTAVIRGYSLTTGKTQSCGCLKAEAPHLPFLPESQPKYTPEEAAARNAWRPRYSEMNFEDFYSLAQLNCHYCGSEPTLIRTSKRKDAVICKFNTLDRIDSELGYIIGNVVPACLICNGGKLNSTMQQFKDRVIRLINNLNRISPQQYRQTLSMGKPDKLHYAELTSAKAVYASYHDGDLSWEQFYQLATANCYYCLAEPSNRRNMSGARSSAEAKKNGTFIYNGLDAINNNLPHHCENVVPSCKYCNTAKSQLTLSEFNDWIKRLADHSHTWM